jgi:hypothetical protein
MPQPNDYQASFPIGVSIRLNGNRYQLSTTLIDLLINARQSYDWPNGTGAAASLQRIITLEAYVSSKMVCLNSTDAHDIVVSVSAWAGNNKNAHNNIVAATANQQNEMRNAVCLLRNPTTVRRGLNALSNLSGLSLVIASKIYRFCVPAAGAAVDRHSSYFFNSLPIDNGFTTAFRREWSNGNHRTSRLATYQNNVYIHNHAEYFDAYLPTLVSIADALNVGGHKFYCQTQHINRCWTPADVEMAAYYWWACNGAR